jgi:hypothetical protein
MSSGAFRANPPELDVPAVEADLARIPAVSSARVVVVDGQVHEVHVVCGPRRSPKLIGRDVQSLLAARWGVDVDHRKVSVVQVDDGDDPIVDLEAEAEPVPAVQPPAPPPAPVSASPVAPRIARVTVAVTGDTAEATVALTSGEQEVVGTASGAPSWVAQRRMAALAALDAIGTIDPQMRAAELSDLSLLGGGAEAVVVSTVAVWRDGFERRLAGAAPVGAGGELRAAAESVVRAVALS